MFALVDAISCSQKGTSLDSDSSSKPWVRIPLVPGLKRQNVELKHRSVWEEC